MKKAFYLIYSVGIIYMLVYMNPVCIVHIKMCVFMCFQQHVVVCLMALQGQSAVHLILSPTTITISTAHTTFMSVTTVSSISSESELLPVNNADYENISFRTKNFPPVYKDKC